MKKLTFLSWIFIVALLMPFTLRAPAAWADDDAQAAARAAEAQRQAEVQRQQEEQPRRSANNKKHRCSRLRRRDGNNSSRPHRRTNPRRQPTRAPS